MYPLEIVVNVGQNVTCECHTEGYAKWLFMDPVSHELMHLPPNAVANETTLFITNAVPKNEGEYECQGETQDRTDQNLRRVQFAARCHVTVNSGKVYKLSVLPISILRCSIMESAYTLQTDEYQHHELPVK